MAYIVEKNIYDELVKWKHNILFNDGDCAYIEDLDDLSNDVRFWIYKTYSSDKDDYIPRDGKEISNRIITIINFIYDDDLFKVEKPKKWVVRSKEADNKGNYMYGYIVPNERLKYMEMAYGKYPSAYFDTKEEAESWANSHQEVVEVEE